MPRQILIAILLLACIQAALSHHGHSHVDHEKQDLHDHHHHHHDDKRQIENIKNSDESADDENGKPRPIVESVVGAGQILPVVPTPGKPDVPVSLEQPE
ncbi:hypothetical protein BsWGS_27702 [Bradybaena similaris]